MILLDTVFDRTLDAWVREFSAPAWRGARVEGWLFEGPEARRSAQATLARAGVTAHLRSAYKPLLHHVLEEVDPAGLRRIEVRYPVHPQAAPNRYTLEAYPLADLLPGVAVSFTAGQADMLDPMPRYALALHYADGRTLSHDVPAPNLLQDTPDGPTLSPTGWLRVRDTDGERVRDAAWRTEYQAVYDAALACVQGQAWHRGEPFFERLSLRIDIPAIEFALDRDEDLLSTCEALHEDLYFSLLEHFQRLSGRPPGDRGLQPGQIVPDVRPHDGPARLRIAAEPFPTAATAAPQPPDSPLAQADAPLAPALIAGHLAALGGEPFRATSRQGRPVQGAYFSGAGPAVLISAGQHANETSGVVGALRAAQALREAGDAHFALIPSENPDGYALHQELCAIHPRHMHHAARYSALGDDVAYREGAPRYEQQARMDALAISGAQLHINLHGYPAHEWTRPLSGYLPRHFELWTLPKGFFLVMRHHAGRRQQAERLIEGVTARLAKLPGLLAFNARQTALFEAHAGQRGFETVNGIAVTLAESNRELAPLALLTEFPDETVYGERFRFAHTVQQAAVLAAVQVYRDG
ncbi:Zinc carboxypeptidase [Bordetella ansorpii]|uniref:Zinc carboxypeptidase n=1 Tax=Bordetella ansorpii TaxID=288768 RepID=A0A157RJ04_9BORD|nr:M14 family zinc carboxypeptidase [Bordetella ansorpii]SAI57846.1 Zinc carboxypeptidase [Bordetella ansorpii]